MRPRQLAPARASVSVHRAQAQGAAYRAAAYRCLPLGCAPGAGGAAGDAPRRQGSHGGAAALDGVLRVGAGDAGDRRSRRALPLAPVRLVGTPNRSPAAVRGSTGAWASAGRACPLLGVSSLDSAGACGLRRLLGDVRATRDGAARAARGDQGDGGDAATAAPSQSVEKVVPGATGDGDGLTSASGTGIMPGSNSPDGASEVSRTRPVETGGCAGLGRLCVPATEKPLGVTFAGFALETGTQPPSAWAWAGLQNQAPGVRLLPLVPDSRRATA